MKAPDHKILYVVLVVAMATWGLSWTNGKILGEYTSIPVLMVWRFFIAALSMLGELLFRKTSIRINLRGALTIFASGLLLVLYNHAYFTGTKLGAAGAGGVLVTTLNPVLTFILVSAVQRKLPGNKALLGIFLGVLGGSILINVWQIGWSAVFSSGNQYFVLCATSWAFLTLISARINEQMSSLTFSFWLYLSSAVIALFLIGDANLLTVFHYDVRFWLNLFSVSIGAMAFATTAYFIAASRLGSTRASAFIFTVPLSAMGFSMLILGEALKLNVIFGGLLSISAVYLINAKDKKLSGE